MAEFVQIEITKPLPEAAVVDSVYKTEGSVKILGAIGAPPFAYSRVRYKEWYKPEFAEEVDYERGWPLPGTGDFSIDFKPKKEGDYRVTIVATPAPLPLPVAGVFPILAESDVMKVAVGQKPPAVFRFASVVIDGNSIFLTNHDVDSGLLMQKKTTDYLDITPSFEYVGPKKSATISIKAGFRDWAGGFTPKTDAYTATIELPETPDVPHTGTIPEPIRIPLTACGDTSDGAIEVVAKIPGIDDYISQIWNVYRTKPPVVNFRFSAIIIDGNEVNLINHDADSGLLLPKTTADHLAIVPAFEWQGPQKTAKISIKAGYKDWTGGFSPKTSAYTRNIELPESIETVWEGQLESPINVPLTACGGLTDGAIEVVLKIADVPDYISHIWNVYATKKEEELQTLEVDITPAAGGYVTTEPDPEEGVNHFVNGSTAKYKYGERVRVTAHANAGYVFDHWSDEIEGGVSYDNPEYVSGTMTESKTVKAHFKEEPVTPPSADIRNFDFMPTAGTYNIGDKVPFTAKYEYKGMKQAAQLVLSLGKGVYPSFFKVVGYAPMPLSFEEAMYWTSRSFSGTFILTIALEPGQKYNVRAKLETLTDLTAETDTDWGLITIAEEGLGSFTVYPMNMPLPEYLRYWCVEWEANGEYYYSMWDFPDKPLRVPSSGEAPLVGRISAWLAPIAGDNIKYGPTIKYTLQDGGVYSYDITGNVLYTR